MATMEELEKEAERDLQFNMNFHDIAVYSSQVAKLISKWSRYRSIENFKIKSKQQSIRELYQKKYDYYAHNYETILDKKEIDIYIKGNEEFSNELLKCDTMNIKLDFIISVCDALKTQSYHITNITKLLELDAGK